MKTAIVTISVIFLLSLKTVFAGNDLESPGTTESITESLLKTLAPVTPKEATFDEEISGMEKTALFGSLAPTTPKTAGFDDLLPTDINLKDIMQLLAPKSPKEVDFNDTMETNNNISLLKLVTPKEASFEEIK